MKRILLIVLIVVCSLLTLVIYPFIKDTISNNNALENFSNNLFNYPNPPQTNELSKESLVGILVANSNHCDFKARKILETTLSKEEINTYYNNAEFPSAKGDSKVKLEVQFLKSYDFNKLIYCIQILEDGYDSGFDLRCS